MNALLAYCSPGLLARLAGPCDPRLVPVLALARVAREVRELEPLHARIIRSTFGLDTEPLDLASIAAQLGLPVECAASLLDEALIELGWALVCAEPEAWCEEVAA